MITELFYLGHQLTLHPSSGDDDKIEGLAQPNVPGPPAHYYAGDQELFYVLEGEMAFILDNKAVMVKKSICEPTAWRRSWWR